MKSGRLAPDTRREAIYIALAAAEVCWAAPLFLALSRAAGRHVPALLWLGLLTLLLGFFYLYRALVRADLSLRLQQSLLAAALLLSIGLLLRFHLYAGAALQGVEWFLEPLRRFSELGVALPDELIAILTLIYLWARGIKLARRSLSADSVGFSFRAGIVILVWLALVITLVTGRDVSGFVISYFFFGLVAVALARVEEVRRMSASDRASFGGFWIGSTAAAVALVVLLGAGAAAILSGGGLAQVFRWLSPLLAILELLLVALALPVLGLLEFLFSLLPLDWGLMGERVQKMLAELRGLGEPLLPRPGQAPDLAPVLGRLQAGLMAATVVVLIALVILFTWQRVRRGRRGEGDESRESLLTMGVVAHHLLATLRAGRDRLGELTGLVDRFGLGPRLLSAISVRRIYANLVRLAAQAGYPRAAAQTPFEYLATLYKAFPGCEADLQVITEAYVHAHYGQAPDSREELQRIRECWERVRGKKDTKVSSQ